jgi:hypothetical protein
LKGWAGSVTLIKPLCHLLAQRLIEGKKVAIDFLDIAQ